MTTYFFISIYLCLILRLSWIDWRTGLLPDKLTCPLLWCGLIYQLICEPTFLHSAVLGAIGGYVFLFLVYWGYRALRRHEGLGFGDVKFYAALGAWHGWQMLTAILLIASAAGLAISLLSHPLSRFGVKVKNPLPFGPFLAAAGLLSVGFSYYPPVRSVLMPLL